MKFLRREFKINAVSPHSRRASTAIELALILVLMSLIPVNLHGQVATADVLGSVTDPSGAIIPNASVTLTDRDTAATRNGLTGQKGEYIFSLVPNGRYSLKVTAPGFKSYVIGNLFVSTGERIRVDAKLETGTVEETVTVSTSPAPLQTDSSSVTSTVEARDLQDLPLNGRNFINLIQILPGVGSGSSGVSGGLAAPVSSSGASPQDRRPASTIIANGQSDSLNDQLIDGFDNNERYIGLIALRPSLDGIAEIKLDTNNYRAEFGRTAGAVVNVITKAGTNEFHGSAYEYFRNDIFDAAGYFASGSKPEYRLNDFGGSIGGPIKKDKTFFFGDVEDNRSIKAVTFLSTVPTAFERANPGNLSDAGGPTVTPSTLGLALFDLYPYPNLSGLSNNYRSSPRQTQYNLTSDGRVDHTFSAKDLFFARYAYNPVSTLVPEAFPQDTSTGIYPGGKTDQFPGPSTTTAQNVQLDYVHIFSPNLLLDLKTGFTRVAIVSLPLNYGTGAAEKLGIPNVSIPGLPTTNVLPNIVINSWEKLGDAISLPIFNRNNTFQYGGALTYTHGANSLKIGAGLVRRQVNSFHNDEGGGLFVFVAAPPYFNDKANLLTGNPVAVVRGVDLRSFGYRMWETSAYAQDDWRATPKLTLNVGLRYDVFTSPTEAHSAYANFDPKTLSSGVGATNFILGTNDPHVGVATDYGNVAPRVGFAYSVSAKTVVRGAFGLSYTPADLGLSIKVGADGPASILENGNPPYTYSYSQSYPKAPPLSAGAPVPSVVDLSTYASNSNVTSLTATSRNLRSTYVEEMNLFLQHEIGKNTFTAGYVGVLGRELLRNVNYDQASPPGAGNPAPSYVYAKQLPNVNTIIYNYNGGASSYDALQLIFTRRATKGFTLNANYTLSHDLADNLANTDTNNAAVDYGNSDFDVRSRATAIATYTFPVSSSAHGMKALLINGWTANSLAYWQSGLPFTVYSTATQSSGLLYVNLPGVSEERPNIVGNAALAHRTVNEWFDITAFHPQSVGTAGTERQNQLRGPQDRRLDLSFIKQTILEKGVGLEFRAECFNVTNTSNFAVPYATSAAYVAGADGTLVPAPPSTGTTFGTITSLASNENPRQFQFALKVLF